MPLPTDELNYRDHCLIIVGDGGSADELLARRRLEAGGRLAHFLLLTDDQACARRVLKLRSCFGLLGRGTRS